MEIDFTYLAVCSCGAVTVTVNGKDYSMSAETFKERYGFDANNTTQEFKEQNDFEVHSVVLGNCNHCINHWGIDLCACGSGAPFEWCDEAHEMCHTPMQNIEENKTHCTAQGGWLP